jgi:hypothetical protein
LKNACDDFKIKNGKMEFDHKLIKTWEDVAKYRPQVEPYLTRDVDAGARCYPQKKHFSSNTFDNLGIDWNLLPGTGIYTSIDIKNAIENG